jgi:uroporphyrinogen-III synthase
LRERGASVESIAVYQRKPPNLSERYLSALRSAERPWITLLSSGLSLSNLLEALPENLSKRWREEAIVVSSERLVEEARTRGFIDVHEAASALPADLLACAGTVLSRHRL